MHPLGLSRKAIHRLTAWLLLLAGVFLVAFLANAQEKPEGPDTWKLEDNKFSWSEVSEADSILISYGPCEDPYDDDEDCDWTYDDVPSDPNVITKTLSPDQRSLVIHNLPECVPFAVQIQVVRNGVTSYASGVMNTKGRCPASPSKSTGGGASSVASSGGSQQVILVSTCVLMPGSVQINGYTGNGVQCSHLGAGGVAAPDVIKRGPIDAVDLWGDLGGGVEACFRNSGSIVLLDASTSPRTEVPLAAYRVGDMTCAKVDRAGTVVLLPGAAPAPPATSADSLQAQQISLSDCSVQTRYNVNLRAEPAGVILTVIGAGRTLAANARTTDWYEKARASGLPLTDVTRTSDWIQVELYGQAGWISADYVTMVGSCG